MVLQIKNKFEEMKRYRESTSISQSLLTSLSKSPGTLSIPRKDTSYFTLGSLVDTLAFFGEDGFNEIYKISSVKHPTDIMWNYHTLLSECYMLGKGKEEAEEIAYKQSGIKLTKATVEKRYLEEVVPYLKEQDSNVGKILVSKQDVSHAKALVRALYEDVYCAKYFKAGNKFQEIVTGEIEGLPCKGLIDILDIDETNKTLRVVDLKTTSKPMYSFHKSIVSYRYDLQLAYYTKLLSLSPLYKGYEILRPRIIAINVSNLEPPIVFELSEMDLEVAENGGRAYDGTNIKGYRELLREYAFINSTNSPYFKEYVDNGGVINLNIYGGNLEVR